MKIIVDSREPKTRKFNAKTTWDKHDVRIEKLSSADFLFEDQVSFEYKTVEDFIQSVIDKRVFQQTLRQTIEYPYNYLIIVGNEQDKYHALRRVNQYMKFTDHQYESAINYLSTAVSIVHNDNETNALHQMLYIANITLKRKHLKPVKYENNPVLNYLCSIHGVNTKTAHNIIETLDVKTLKDLLTINPSQLITVDGIGEKTSKNIMEAIK